MIRAAGALLWRPGPAGPEVAGIHRPRRGEWSFLKGELDPTETARAAAVREVREQTGFAITFDRKLPPRLSFAGRRLERVDYWTLAAAAFTSKTARSPRR